MSATSPVTRDVTVSANNVTQAEFGLTAQAIQGETIVVTGQAKGQMEAINQKLASNQIIDVVSAEKMKELPDANIAESIGRLPGISLQRNAGEATGVVVRGMSPKYNEVTIEGVPMTSTNYYDRGIDLSILSDDLVRGVEVSKSLRADMDADAFGGVVNLTLKTADPGLHYSLMGNGAYNNLRDTYRNYKFAASVSDRFLDDQVGILVLGNIEQKQLPSDQFAAAYDLPTFDNATHQYFINTNNATLTQSNVNRHRYGASLIFDYTSDLVDVKFLNVYDQKRDSNITRTYASFFENNNFNYNILVNETKTEQRTHTLSALFKLGETELPVSVAYTRSDQTIPQGMEFDFQETNVASVPGTLWQYGEPLNLMRVQGVMDPSNSASVLWNMYQGSTGLRDDSYDLKADWKIPFVLSDALSGKFSVGAKYHEVQRESSNGRYYYNVQYGSNTRRQNLINAIPFLQGANPNPNASGGISAGPYFVDPNYTTRSILGYPIGPGFDVGKLISMMKIIYPAWLSTFYQDGPSWYNQFYNDKEYNRAAYVMTELNLGSDLTVVPGVRYQEERTSIEAYHVKLNGSNQNGLAGEAPRLAESERTTPGWYPSVSVKYRVNDNISVLGGAFKSMSLPSFGEVTPQIIYGIQANYITTGNPMLRPSTAWNFDLGANYSSNDVGLISVNMFYKEISNLIYAMQNYTPYFPYQVQNAPDDIWNRIPGPGSNYYDAAWAQANNASVLTTSIPMNDPSRAFLRGIEISWQVHLWYLPGVLSGVVLDFNAAYMSSRQYYPSFNPVTTGSGLKKTTVLVYQTTSGSLQDQPRATYNAILGWDYKGFSSRFSLRYQQQTLTSMDTQFGLRNAFYDNVNVAGHLAQAAAHRQAGGLLQCDERQRSCRQLLLFPSGVRRSRRGRFADQRADLRMGRTVWGQLQLLIA